MVDVSRVLDVQPMSGSADVQDCVALGRQICAMYRLHLLALQPRATSGFAFLCRYVGMMMSNHNDASPSSHLAVRRLFCTELPCRGPWAYSSMP